MTTVSVFGLGYVGSVLIACLADSGYDMIGVDISQTKVDMINEGYPPVVEKGLGELLKNGVLAGKVRATTNAREAVLASDASFVCVGTPSNANGSLNTNHVAQVCEDIGTAMSEKDGYHIVVMRSTMLPGTTEEMAIPILEQTSGKKAGETFGVCFNPEFLREGSSIEDFYNPPYTIIGAEDEKAISMVQEIYSMLSAPVLIVPFKVAEMVKYVNNTFHALKVTFANEIGVLCKQMKIDSHQVMDIFTMDTKLNLSPYYLKPGYAFGGSCLPKDLRALLYQARRLDVQTPVLESILPSNDRQVELAYEMIKNTGKKRVGILGFSFKEGTDDLRESPLVELIEKLIGKGFDVRIYDRNVILANLQGSNQAYIEKEVPHVASLMADSIEEILDTSEIIVVGTKSKAFQDIFDRMKDDQVLIDLVRIVPSPEMLNGRYQGISW
ncbi:MAG: nucleotide sugar dehydrogenase [Chloroflexi bacterium]|nr:MAG: nucleotide sugar dehydrogenase [Chloroflexota bacterium]